MKRFIKIPILVILFLFTACEKECINDTGAMSVREITVGSFHELIIYDGVEVHLLNGSTQKVWVEAGDHQWENLTLQLKGNTLEINAKVPCLIGKNPDIKIFITNPVLQLIRNSGKSTVFTDEVLKLSELTLISENYENEYKNFGNFDMEVETKSFKVISNGVSNFYIDGFTENFEIHFYGGTGKFEGKNFIATHVLLYHRGENTLRIFPEQSLQGECNRTLYRQTLFQIN